LIFVIWNLFDNWDLGFNQFHSGKESTIKSITGYVRYMRNAQLGWFQQLIQPTAKQSDGFLRAQLMAAIAPNAFVIVDEGSFFDKADSFHRTTFDTRPTPNASIPNHPGPDRERVFKHRFKQPLIPRH
jgi:hypothetical protein